MNHEPAAISISRPVDPDQQLVRLAKTGDFDAFEQLVGKYERDVFTLATRIVRNTQDAEEVVQETFLSIVEHLRDFKEASTFHTWLVRIATNHALKVLRRRRSRPTVPLQVDSGDEDSPLPHPDFVAEWRDNPQRLAEQRETQEILTDSIMRLEEKYRLVFLLRDVEGLSTEETAESLGITLSNAKVRLLRARLMLRERLTRLFGNQAKRLIASHNHDQ